MKIIVFISLLILIFYSFFMPKKGTYSGYYTYGFETSYFLPEGKKDKWWLSGVKPCPEIQVKYNSTNATPILFIVVNGNLSGKGSYGHMGAYTRQLEATEIISCRIIRSNEHPVFNL